MLSEIASQQLLKVIKMTTRRQYIKLSLLATGLSVASIGGAIALGHLTNPNYGKPARPAGCDKTSDIRDTGVGPVRVDVAAYFAERAANAARFG
jgi:hypothetical protein